MAFRRGRWGGLWLFAWLALTARAGDADYRSTLHALCDALVATQIQDPGSPEYGALVCPSTNPQEHPLHSRAAEAVYPLAVTYRETRDPKYRNAAIHLADWLVRKQQPTGAWGEDWPKYDGWAGTTSDQLISLAGAWPLLQADLTAAQRDAWRASITAAAEYIVRTFPVGNINYQPTGAVALVLASQVVEPSPRWRPKAEALIAQTLAGVNADGLLVGEGKGVDLGYNLAQSIGYLALYALLTHDEPLRRKSAELLRTHATFVYPNGTIDNSWGTRSFKWTYESGTKTAPGVYFTFALLADQDPSFAADADRCLGYLRGHALTSDGLVGRLPHPLDQRPPSPPCLYGTFTRAQSLALALVYGAKPLRPAAAVPAQPAAGSRVFPTVKVAVVRTASMMATISAYGEIRQYGRGLVPRGGSLTNLWIDGFGDDGMAQASSVTKYRREEGAHMPIEPELKPLTPRIEAEVGGVIYLNLCDTEATLSVRQIGAMVETVSGGRLTSVDGTHLESRFRITHRFEGARLEKEYVVDQPPESGWRIVEPFVRHAGMRLSAGADNDVLIAFANGARWRLRCVAGTQPVRISVGDNAEQYWCPFPGVSCVPVAMELPGSSREPVRVTLERVEP